MIPDVEISLLSQNIRYLSDVTDDVAITVRKIEQSLNRAGIKTSGVAIVGDGDYLLCFRKYGKLNERMRICVTNGEDMRPWSECPREVKLKSAQALPDLVETIARRVKESTSLAVDAFQNSTVALGHAEQIETELRS